eukprot:7390854-Prymnesium_polylepis.1
MITRSAPLECQDGGPSQLQKALLAAAVAEEAGSRPAKLASPAARADHHLGLQRRTVGRDACAQLPPRLARRVVLHDGGDALEDSKVGVQQATAARARVHCGVAEAKLHRELPIPLARQPVQQVGMAARHERVECLVAEVANVPVVGARRVIVERVGVALRRAHPREVEELHAAILADRAVVVQVGLLVGDADQRRAEMVKLRPELGDVSHDDDVGVEHDDAPHVARERPVQQRLVQVLRPRPVREPAQVAVDAARGRRQRERSHPHALDGARVSEQRVEANART